MSTGRHTFRLNDTARLIRATEAAGKKVKSVSLEGKRVTVLVDEAAAPDAQPNPLDRVLKDAQDQKRSA